MQLYYIFYYFFFLRYKAVIIIRNSFLVFLLYLICDNNNEVNFNDVSFFFISLLLVFILNYLSILLLGNIITLYDLFINKKKIIDKILFIFIYSLLEIINCTAHLGFYCLIKSILINDVYILGILFFGFFYYGIDLFKYLFKQKRPEFATVIKRFIVFAFELFTAGFCIFQFFEYLLQKKLINEIFLFLLFLIGSFILGFLIEALFTDINLFEKVRKKFNIFFVSLIFLVFSPYILQNKELIIIFLTIMVILIIIKFIKIQYINYFSDLFVLTFIVSFFLDNYIKYSIIIYFIKVLFRIWHI